MNTKLITTDQEDNILPFLKPSPNGVDENWLVKLEVGTCFVCRPRNDTKSLDLMEYHVLHHADKSSTLYLAAPTGQMHRVHVDQLRFSRAMEYVETLGVSRPSDNQEEPANDPTPTNGTSPTV